MDDPYIPSLKNRLVGNGLLCHNNIITISGISDRIQDRNVIAIINKYPVGQEHIERKYL